MSDSSPVDPVTRDVRMRGFARRTTVDDALAWLDTQWAVLPSELINLDLAAGRILAATITSPVDVPTFDRAMMDGYALSADDTLGASPYNRLPLTIVGQSLPGSPWSKTLHHGQAVQIMTGAPLPCGADAVLPAEQSAVENDRLLAHGEVSPGKHVGRAGEDVAKDSTVLTVGRHLRPQDIGVISSIGMPQVPVVRRPQVRIIVTGDEILPRGSLPTGFQITDANGPMLEALARRDGAVVSNPGIVPDQPDKILNALRDEADVVLVSGGSSVGVEDHAPTVLATHGQLAIHGVAMRPSSPAGMGRLEHRLVFLLPGNPVSCLCAYDFFAGRAVRGLAGRGTDWPYRRIRQPLLRKLVSTVGRVDYARVQVTGQGVQPLAISGASVLSSTTRANGFVIIPSDSEGYRDGVEVEVFLYD